MSKDALDKFFRRLKTRGKPGLAVLVDPDKYNPALIDASHPSSVSCFLVGGSKLEHGNVASTVRSIKGRSKIPVFLFPGDEKQLSPNADGLLLPTLVSGRNADYLIGKQVLMAPLIRKMQLDVKSMAYLLISGENRSATEQVTGTPPIPAVNVKKILDTVDAALYMGMQCIYLEAGSGAKKIVDTKVIRAVRKRCHVPLIVGGGITDVQKARQIARCRPDLIVVGNALEKNVHLLAELSSVFSL